MSWSFEQDRKDADLDWLIFWVILLMCIFTLPGLIVIVIWGYLLLRLIAHLTDPNKEKK